MKRFSRLMILSALAVALVAPAADARRLGGGGNIGRQSSSPAMREAPREAPRAAPNPAPAQAPSQAAPAVPPTVQPKPSFLNRWGGVIAGVGVGALLASMMGGHLGGFGAALGGILNILLIAGVLYMAYRFFASRRRAGPNAGAMQFAGAGGPSFGGEPQRDRSRCAWPKRRAHPMRKPSCSRASRFRPASRSNRSCGRPRVLSCGFKRRMTIAISPTSGGPPRPRSTRNSRCRFASAAMLTQRTEILSLDARLLEVVVEGEQMIASLRYSGMVREDPASTRGAVRRRSGTCVVRPPPPTTRG